MPASQPTYSPAVATAHKLPSLSIPSLDSRPDIKSEELCDDPGSAQSKRENNAARRASHNAVERLRRDKLNARIYELASLLPNLAGERRPSRIAITNSSIAHIHGSRRHRILAAQHLRSLHAETEALRVEVNQWRQRAGIPGVLPPRRDEAFLLIASGAELELEPVDFDEEDFEDQGWTSYQRPPFLRTQSPSPFAYGGSPPSSSSSSSSIPSPYSSPPSADFGHPGQWNTKFDVGSPHAPYIACPTPANPFEAQHFMLNTEDNWPVYGGPSADFDEFEHPHGSW